MTTKRGDIYYADLRPAIGSEQGGVRPVLIIQNDIGNKYSPTVIVVPLTSINKKDKMPTHATIPVDPYNGLRNDSMALCEQVKTIDKGRLMNKLGFVSDNIMKLVFKAYLANFGEI